LLLGKGNSIVIPTRDIGSDGVRSSRRPPSLDGGPAEAEAFSPVPVPVPVEVEVDGDLGRCGGFFLALLLVTRVLLKNQYSSSRSRAGALVRPAS
jgi:hypothetical protein